MLISNFVAGAQPRFELVRSGTNVTASLLYDLSVIVDSGEQNFDGEMASSIGPVSDYQRAGLGGPFLSNQLTVAMSVNQLAGSYAVNDFYDGTMLARSFTVVIFGFSTSYSGDAGDNFGFGSDYADTLTGLGGRDGFEGGAGNDTIDGGADDDILIGQAGNDVLIGGAGRDAMDGGVGSDTASYASAAAGLTASLANAAMNTGDAAGDVYAFVENLTGTRFADTLNGNNSANILIGGLGNDRLNGVSGNDRLFGGGGADTFIFNVAPNASNNVDRIEDFAAVDDVIHLQNAIFDALVGTGTLTANQFAANASGVAADANDRIVYETDTGKLFYDGNGSAAGGAVQFATLIGAPVISNLDFFVI